ncbi:hypothetical protein SFUMM280S_06483 [Streptomyces fumanus]
MADTSDTRTPAQIEADIKRRREVLAETLDEIGMRVHPKTIMGDARAKVASNIDRTLGRAYVGVNKRGQRREGTVRGRAGQTQAGAGRARGRSWSSGWWACWPCGTRRRRG